jgi:hypothetical protein
VSDGSVEVIKIGSGKLAATHLYYNDIVDLVMGQCEMHGGTNY